MEQHEAQLNAEEAKQLAEILFEFRIESCKDLCGYFDRNFLLKDVRGRFFVLKVMNARVSENLTFLEQQNEAMRAVAAEGLTSQEPIKSKEGRFTEVEELKGRNHAIRLLTFAEGVTLESAEVRIDALLMRSIGGRVAKIDQVLSRTFAPNAVSRDHLWSAYCIPRLLNMMQEIPVLEDRELLTDVFSYFEERLLPKMEELTSGPIHSDANFANIIIQGDTSGFLLSSIIDFGDLHSSAHIYGLASLCAYVMLSFDPHQWTVDISEYSAPKHCIAGYLSEHTLPRRELELLPKFVALRYAQSLAIGAYSFYVLNPQKQSHLDTQKVGWRQLQFLWTTNHDALLMDWLSETSKQ